MNDDPLQFVVLRELDTFELQKAVQCEILTQRLYRKEYRYMWAKHNYGGGRTNDFSRYSSVLIVA